MHARLTVCSVDQAASEFDLDKNKTYSIGRSNDNDIVITAPSISRHHASLSFINDHWIIRDLGSQNGIWLDGIRLNDATLLKNSAVKVGNVSLLFELLDEQDIKAENEHNKWRLDSVANLLGQVDTEASENTLFELLTNLVRLANMHRGILLLGKDSNDMRMKITCGMLAQDLTVEEFSGSVGAIQEAIKTAKPVISMDTSTHSMLSQRETTQLKNIAALACIPLFNGDEIIGLVYTDSQEPGKILKKLDLDILMSISDQISTNLQSLAFQNNLLNVLEQLKEQNLPSVIDIPLSDFAV